MSSQLLFEWRTWEKSSKEAQEFMLKEMGIDNLCNMSLPKQLEFLQDAPEEVILRCFKNLLWDCQVVLWKKSLSEKGRIKAFPLLKEQAAIKLGLRLKRKHNVFC